MRVARSNSSSRTTTSRVEQPRFLGLAAWTSGDLEAAQRSYAECMASVWQAGHLSDALGAAITQADIRVAQGRLREAMRTYEKALNACVDARSCC